MAPEMAAVERLGGYDLKVHNIKYDHATETGISSNSNGSLGS